MGEIIGSGVASTEVGKHTSSLDPTKPTPASAGTEPEAAASGNVDVVESDEETIDALDPDYVGPAKTVTQEYSVAQEADPQRSRPGGEGIYLDREQRKAAEIQRANLEGREPDLDNPPPIAGTPVYPTEVLKSRYPGDYEIPVAGTQEVVVGTDDSTGLAPEQFEQYQNEGGTLSEDHSDDVLEKHESAQNTGADQSDAAYLEKKSSE